MTAASRSLATALGKARFASGLLRPSYTIIGDTTRRRRRTTGRIRRSDKGNTQFACHPDAPLPSFC
jgi:hypothetical protein